MLDFKFISVGAQSLRNLERRIKFSVNFNDTDVNVARKRTL